MLGEERRIRQRRILGQTQRLTGVGLHALSFSALHTQGQIEIPEHSLGPIGGASVKCAKALATMNIPGNDQV